jgi:hypothetical protein
MMCACMEHRCQRCDWFDMDNTRGPASCPKCGADVSHDFDENPRDFRDDRDDDAHGGDDIGEFDDDDSEDLDNERD